jgi:heptaprenyl diphosphate synthase
MSRTKRLALMAALAAIALTIFVAEAQLPPPVPIPGIKLGLSNIVTLVAMAVLGRREAGAVLAVRILLGSVFTGSVSALIFSAAGGLFAYLVMCLTVNLFPRKLLWVVSTFAALAHNAGQLAAAVWVSGTPSILVYAPALVASGVVTGVFTGFGAMYLIRALERLNRGPASK